MPEKLDAQSTPVLVIGFNRPETISQLWNALAAVKPSKIYFACDAPRTAKPAENEKVDLVRKSLSLISWPCEIKTLFQTENQGCGKGPYLAMDWFFSQEEAGIILEDDCIPHADFFSYSAELLEKYRSDTRVMTIAGDASPLAASIDFGGLSYGFSRLSLTWGWATWRRAWTSFNFTLDSWPRMKDRGWLRGLIQNEDAYNSLHDAFEGVYSGRHSTVWDYQWSYNCLCNSGLSIIPSVNLISNIGFGEGATHTSDEQSIRAQVPVHPLPGPLAHPPSVFPWIELDHSVLFRAMGVRRTGYLRRFVKKLFRLPRDRKHYGKVS